MQNLSINTAQRPLRIATIGYGALARELVQAIQSGALPNMQFIGALVVERPTDPIPFWQEVSGLLRDNPDIVVEAAGHAALRTYGVEILRGGVDLVTASVGALLADDLLERLLQTAREAGRQLLLPSGALGGLDYLRAARLAGPVEVLYRSRKPASAWRGTHAEHLVELSAVQHLTVFFRGAATEAVARFPQNANVVAALSIAVGSAEAVQVELCVDPSIGRNIHEVQAHGVTGTMQLCVENEASSRNPKSSRITAYSLLETIAAHCVRYARFQSTC